jgi:hypothetical protein
VPNRSIAACEESVNVMASGSALVILPEVPTTWNAKLPKCLVAQALHARHLLIQAIDALHFKQDVNDGFGYDAWNGGAADVVHRDAWLTERLNDADRFNIERVPPIRIVRNDSHVHCYSV